MTEHERLYFFGGLLFGLCVGVFIVAPLLRILS